MLSLLLAACASNASGPQFSALEAPAGKAMIHVYAPAGFGGYGEPQVVEIDGKLVGKLHPRGFISKEVTPGPHKVVVKSSITNAILPGLPLPGESVTLAAGENAYFRVFSKYDGLAFSPGGGAMPIYLTETVEVPEQVGASEIRNTRASQG
ncbi:MAG: DUF2846 domain-containing protein [Hyphomicrobiales bacterium]